MEINTEKNINCNMFVIPNPCAFFKEHKITNDIIMKYHPDFSKEDLEEYKKKKHMVSSSELLKKMFPSVNFKDEKDIPLVQLWLYSEECDNICRHRHFKYDDEFNVCLPEYFPADVLKDVKEGDKIEFDFLGVHFIATAKQKGSRYERFGNFEGVKDECLEIGIGLKNGTWELDLEHWCYRPIEKKKEAAV